VSLALLACQVLYHILKKRAAASAYNRSEPRMLTSAQPCPHLLLLLISSYKPGINGMRLTTLQSQSRCSYTGVHTRYARRPSLREKEYLVSCNNIFTPIDQQQSCIKRLQAN
jgi:hypothetical protein